MLIISYRGTHLLNAFTNGSADVAERRGRLLVLLRALRHQGLEVGPPQLGMLFVEATRYQKLDLAWALLRLEGASVCGVDNDGHDALHYAVRAKDPGMIRFLVHEGYVLNGSPRRAAEEVKAAVISGSAEVLQLLLAAGVRIEVHGFGAMCNVIDHQKHSQEHAGVLGVLVAAGACACGGAVQNRRHLTWLACANGCVGVVSAMAAAGQLEAQGAWGAACLDHARKVGHTEVVRLLQKARSAQPGRV